ncbi:MAG TPA: hypothetical protein VKT70_05900 [Stellaceae bacterium]|nr:hypothetical protein [Stellaceae bacterium]
MKTLLLLGLVTLVSVREARADEASIRLLDKPGHEQVEGACAVCHSLDYIPMNGGFLAPQAWEAEVNKMIKVFGAPIPPEDAKGIIDYLGKNYGVPPR